MNRDRIMDKYEELTKTWIERIATRVKLVLEGVSTVLAENFIITGGGSLLPGVYEMLKENFADIGDVKRPDDPIRANSIGYYMLAQAMVEKVEPTKEVEEAVEPTPEVEEAVEG